MHTEPNLSADTERTAGMADALEFVWWQQLGLDKDEIDPDQSDGSGGV